MNKKRCLHLFLTDTKQLIVGLCNNIDELNVLNSQFFVAPFLKIGRYLFKKSTKNIQHWAH